MLLARRHTALAVEEIPADIEVATHVSPKGAAA
jgi:hypothetical protein